MKKTLALILSLSLYAGSAERLWRRRHQQHRIHIHIRFIR